MLTVIVGIEMELVDGRLHAEFRLHVPDGGEYGPFTLSPTDDAKAERMRVYFEQRGGAQPGATPSSNGRQAITSAGT